MDGLHAEESGGKTGLSPSPVPCSKGINPGHPPGTPGTTPRRDWQHGLFPLQSPLLRESWLVSFPPLNYMLKFSGSSCVHQVQGKGALSLERERENNTASVRLETRSALVVPAGYVHTTACSTKRPTPRWRWCPVTDLPHPHQRIHGSEWRCARATPNRLECRSTLRGMPAHVVVVNNNTRRQRPDSTARTSGADIEDGTHRGG